MAPVASFGCSRDVGDDSLFPPHFHEPGPGPGGLPRSPPKRNSQCNSQAKFRRKVSRLVTFSNVWCIYKCIHQSFKPNIASRVEMDELDEQFMESTELDESLSHPSTVSVPNT